VETPEGIYERPSQVYRLSTKIPEETVTTENGNVIINAALESLRRKQACSEDESVQPAAGHRNVIPVQAPIDYSEVFEEWIGNTEGVYVLRIEDFRPVLQEPVSHGKFCVADSYIILLTTKTNEEYKNDIYTWIGGDSETDKKFCCAMYAVALRNKIRSSCRIIRIVFH
jgi:hypothetical protein